MTNQWSHRSLSFWFSRQVSVCLPEADLCFALCGVNQCNVTHNAEVCLKSYHEQTGHVSSQESKTER